MISIFLRSARQRRAAANNEQPIEREETFFSHNANVDDDDNNEPSGFESRPSVRSFLLVSGKIRLKLSVLQHHSSVRSGQQGGNKIQVLQLRWANQDDAARSDSPGLGKQGAQIDVRSETRARPRSLCWFAHHPIIRSEVQLQPGNP